MPKLSENLAIVDRLQAVGRQPRPRRGRSGNRVDLRHPVVTGALVGARTAKQVEGVMRAADLRLSDAKVGEIGSKTDIAA